MIGEEDEHGCGIGAAEVSVDGRELFLLAAAAVERLEIADKDDLERHHQRRRLREVERVEDAGVGKVEIVQAEVALVRRRERGEDTLTTTLVEERLVA